MYEIYCKIRDEKGYKDSDVVRATGITKSTFSDWKNGRSNPKTEKLQKIADYFGVSVDYLMNGIEPEFSIEMAKTDAIIARMDNRMKEYALKMAKLTDENQLLIMQMIDKLSN